MSMTALKPLHAILPPGFPEGLKEIAEWLFLQLLDEQAAGQLNATEAELAAMALRLADRLSLEMGGSAVYIQKGSSWRLTPRNLQMCQEFRGDYRVLARKYGLTEQQVRNIVDGWQRQQFLARQGDLLADSAADAAAEPAAAPVTDDAPVTD